MRTFEDPIASTSGKSAIQLLLGGFRTALPKAGCLACGDELSWSELFCSTLRRIGQRRLSWRSLIFEAASSVRDAAPPTRRGPREASPLVKATNMFQYKACGLGIHSELPLYELVENDAAGEDIIIQVGRVDYNSCVQKDGWNLAWAADSNGVVVYWEGVGACWVKDGREITIDACNGSDTWRVCHLILGVGLGIAMHQRGRVVLHASAISLTDRAILFVAKSCGGKSTTAAAFHSWGYGIVADDLVVVDVPEVGDPRVLPASRQIKVCPPAMTFLDYDARTLSSLLPHDERLAYQEVETFRTSPLSPLVIYILAEGMEESVEPLRPRQALLEIIRYTQPIVTEILAETGTAAGHFQHCGRLANRVAVHRLNRRMDLLALHGLKRIIEDDLSKLLAEEIPTRCLLTSSIPHRRPANSTCSD
jgi:hypothetical protein